MQVYGKLVLGYVFAFSMVKNHRHSPDNLEERNFIDLTEDNKQGIPKLNQAPKTAVTTIGPAILLAREERPMTLATARNPFINEGEESGI